MNEFVDKRIQRSKSAIKETCFRLLYEKPFEEISISEIVREANYNRGTFYANFASKDELLAEMIDDVLKEMINEIRHPYKAIKDVKLKELNTQDITLFQYFKENAALYKLLLSEHIRVDFRYQMAKVIEEMFVAEYEYKLAENSILDRRLLYIYRAHGIAGLIIRWIEDDFPSSSEYMAEQVVELMITATESFVFKKMQEK